MDAALGRQAVRQLLHSIHAAIEAVTANAAAARLQASIMPLADGSPDDDIQEAIDSAERIKIVALESEAVAPEAILECLDGAGEGPDDPASIARIAVALSDALALPTKHTEPIHISLLEGPRGRILVAPRRIHPSHVVLAVPPRIAFPGRNLILRLALSNAYPSRIPKELEIMTSELSLVRVALELVVGGRLSTLFCRVTLPLLCAGPSC